MMMRHYTILHPNFRILTFGFSSSRLISVLPDLLLCKYSSNPYNEVTELGLPPYVDDDDERVRKKGWRTEVHARKLTISWLLSYLIASVRLTLPVRCLQLAKL